MIHTDFERQVFNDAWERFKTDNDISRLATCTIEEAREIKKEIYQRYWNWMLDD